MIEYKQKNKIQHFYVKTILHNQTKNNHYMGANTSTNTSQNNQNHICMILNFSTNHPLVPSEQQTLKRKNKIPQPKKTSTQAQNA